MICVVVMTDGRERYISEAVPSFERYLAGNVTRHVIHDDSGDADYRRWLNYRFPTWELIATGERHGFAGAYRAARRWLAASTTEPFIFSTEDDFVLQRPIDLVAYGHVLDTHRYLAQLAALRQPCNDAEELAGGVIEQRADAYVEQDVGFARWLEHRLFWTTNPHLARRETLTVEWPDVANSEGTFTHQLLRDGLGDVDGDAVRFGYIGKRDDPPLVIHIETIRAGIGY